MSEPEENEEFSIEESLQILQDTGKKIEKEQEDFKKNVVPLIKKKGKTIYEVDVDKKQLKSLEKQYSIILSSAMRFVNPLLKAWKITPLDDKEINTLSKAILNVSESKIKQTVRKIEKRFDSIGRLTKIMNLIAVFWELAVPRYGELKISLIALEAKAKKVKLGVVKQ